MTQQASGPPTSARRLSLGRGTVWLPVYGSRLLVWLTAVLAFSLLPPGHALIAGFDPHGVTEPFHSGLLDRLLAPTARYDSVWYLQIAQHGYFTPQASAFFPLYPLLIGVLGVPLGNPLLAGLLISLVAMVVAFRLLYRLAVIDTGEPAARITVVLVALFPMSLFMSAVYTESLFMAVSIGAIYAARTDRWALAGLLGALASAARSDGVGVLVALVVMFLYGPRGRPAEMLPASWWRPRFRLTPQVLWLALVPVGLLAYMAYCAAAHGTPLAPFNAAAHYWGRSFKGPLSEFIDAVAAVPNDIHLLSVHQANVFVNGDPLNWTSQNLIDLGWIPLVAVGLIASARTLPVAYTLYALAIVVASGSNPSPLEPMMSFARYVIPAFPLFLGPACWLVSHRRTRYACYGVSAGLLIFFSAMWGQWYWVA